MAVSWMALNTRIFRLRLPRKGNTGYLSGSDLQAVSDWVKRNEAVLVDYWDFRIDTDELLQRLHIEVLTGVGWV